MEYKTRRNRRYKRQRWAHKYGNYRCLYQKFGQQHIWDDYPAFKWVAQQNGQPNGGWNAVNDKWYLPAKEELKALYGTYNGDVVVDNKVMLTVDASLKAIGVTPLASPYYWSSTETETLSSTNSWYVYFANGTATNCLKSESILSARCVREF